MNGTEKQIVTMPLSQKSFKKEIKRRLLRWQSRPSVICIEKGGEPEKAYLIHEIPEEIKENSNVLRYYFVTKFGKHLPYGWNFTVISKDDVRWVALRKDKVKNEKKEEVVLCNTKDGNEE